MSALPFPDLPPGPHRDLVEALHDLHHRAGWPSLRTLAGRTGVSHTTVSHAFSSPRLTTWGTLELLVEALGGDTGHFHDLWLAATTPTDGPPSAPRIAGRTTELAVVRRHLETGTGLLLVTGEAGIGKTTLIETAADGASSLVLSTRCLPLSQQTPLMPVIDLLRTLLETDGGRLFEASLAACPPYVAGSLTALLPEIDATRSVPPADEFARERLFAAVRTMLFTVAGSRRLGLVLDDLHWADTSTLDLVEYLAMRDPAVGIVGTWRENSPDTLHHHLAWLARVRRQSARQVIELGPLDRDETATQLTLLLGRETSAGQVDSVFGRTLGHPLFTTQLAATGADADLPPLLTDLLDDRLGDLSGEQWAVARVLGLADRPLPVGVLAAVTDLDPTQVIDVLRVLAHRHLLAPGDREASLAHPLIAEGVRRLLVPGEAAGVHSRLAHALADRDDTSPAEVAAHFRAADECQHEFSWRIRAAQEAHERTAPREEAEHWLRALDIWPADPTIQPTPHKEAVELAAVNALDGAGQEPAGLALASSALGLGLSMHRDDRFELAIRAAGIMWGQHGPERALEVLDDAEQSYGDGMSPDNRVRCLRLRASLLSKSGHSDEALDLLDEAVGLCGRVTDPDVRIRLFASRGWHLGFTGDLAAAVLSFDEARTALREASTPDREAFVAMMHTDVLLYHERPPVESEAAARTALQQIEELDLRSTITNMVRSNVAESWLNAGEPARAAEFLIGDEPTADDYSMWPLRWVAARVAIAAGRLDDALDLLGQPYQDDLFAQLSLAGPTSEAMLWSGRAENAAALLTDVLERALGTDTVGIAGPAFVMLARSLADSPAATAGEDPARRVRTLRSRALVDPLGPGSVPAIRPGCTAQWDAEVARMTGRDTVDLWLRAATQWDGLTRPHDAAYCRWRGARVALREGRGTLASQLLTRASTDARQHVPLHRAIRATMTGDH